MDKRLCYIIPNPLKEGDIKRYYVANIFIDQAAFMTWLTSKAYNTGGADISNMVVVVAPRFINDYLYRYYMDRAKKIRNLVSEEMANKIDKDSDKFLHVPYIHKLNCSLSYFRWIFTCSFPYITSL